MKVTHHYNAHCTNVVDGDTIDCVVDLGFRIEHRTRLRLLGIDTPELRSGDPKLRAVALVAKERVEELCLKQDIVIFTEKAGSFGRWLARVYVHQEEEFVCINDLLLQESLASVY